MTVIPLDGSASSLLSGASLRRTTVDSSAVTDGAVVVARVDGADKDEHEEEDEGEGHSSCSSVCGLEVELTPEELGPPPMYAKEDTIALLAAQEEEVERARGGEAADDNQQDDEEDGSGEEGDEEEARARSPVLLFGRRNSPPLSPSRDGDAV